MKKYFIIALAALGFAACAEKMNDGPSPEQTGELEQSYIAINLMSSELDTRVNDDTPVFEDGEEAERKVNSVHFFFFRQGVPFAVNAAGTAPGGGKNWLTATPNPDFDKDTEDANISDYSEVTLVLNNYKGQYPDQIVAVINWTPDQNVYKLDELHAKLIGLQGNNGGFVMSNSVYMSGSKMIDATAIDESNIGEDEGEAKSNPVNIYVERVAAKVKVSTPATSDSEGNWIKEKDWFYTGQTSNLITPDDKKVYVKIQNWSLYNARTQSTLLKSINPTWTNEALGLTWNDSPRFRSYWAAADTYTDSPDDYINNNVFIWNDGTALGGVLYCGENTAQLDEDRTKLILKGKLVDVQGNALELVKWNGQEMVKVANLKTAVAAQLQYLVYSYTEDNEGKKTYTSISDTDLDCISGTEDSAPGNVNNYQVYFQLTSTASGKKWATKSGETYIDQDAAQINTYLAGNIPAATVYADGQTYYHIDIKHLGTSGKTAEYGIVRNHIYDIEIQSIKGYGTPVFIPGGNIVVPETPIEEEGVYVAAKINVLSWRVVKQGVNIDVQ